MILTVILIILIACQVTQWIGVLVFLHDNKGQFVTTKKDLLIKMAPGYFFVYIARFAWNTFEKFMMLE